VGVSTFFDRPPEEVAMDIVYRPYSIWRRSSKVVPTDVECHRDGFDAVCLPPGHFSVVKEGRSDSVLCITTKHGSWVEIRSGVAGKGGELSTPLDVLRHLSLRSGNSGTVEVRDRVLVLVFPPRAQRITA
jgi:hypothetical protein